MNLKRAQIRSCLLRTQKETSFRAKPFQQNAEKKESNPRAKALTGAKEIPNPDIPSFNFAICSVYS